MSVIEQAKLIIYRLKEKGLEIFLIQTGDNWELPGVQIPPHAGQNQEMIPLDPQENAVTGRPINAVAIEGDWHDMPSLKKLLAQDVDHLKDQIQKLEPEMDKGAFFALSDAIRKVTPDYNAYIKELKEIIRDRNIIRYL